MSISKTSGAAGIAYWINEHYDRHGDEKFTKDDKLVKDLKVWVDEMYADGPYHQPFHSGDRRQDQRAAQRRLI